MFVCGSGLVACVAICWSFSGEPPPTWATRVLLLVKWSVFAETPAGWPVVILILLPSVILLFFAPLESFLRRLRKAPGLEAADEPEAEPGAPNPLTAPKQEESPLPGMLEIPEEALCRHAFLRAISTCLSAITCRVDMQHWKSW